MLMDRRHLLQVAALSPLVTLAFAAEKPDYAIRIAKGLVEAGAGSDRFNHAL
jgi:hypothetical protein